MSDSRPSSESGAEQEFRISIELLLVLWCITAELCTGDDRQHEKGKVRNCTAMMINMLAFLFHQITHLLRSCIRAEPSMVIFGGIVGFRLPLFHASARFFRKDRRRTVLSSRSDGNSASPVGSVLEVQSATPSHDSDAFHRAIYRRFTGRACRASDGIALSCQHAREQEFSDSAIENVIAASGTLQRQVRRRLMW